MWVFTPLLLTGMGDEQARKERTQSLLKSLEQANAGLYCKQMESEHAERAGEQHRQQASASAALPARRALPFRG